MIKWIRWEVPRRYVFVYILHALLSPQIVGYFIFAYAAVPFTAGVMIQLYIIQDFLIYITGMYQNKNDRT